MERSTEAVWPLPNRSTGASNSMSLKRVHDVLSKVRFKSMAAWTPWHRLQAPVIDPNKEVAIDPWKKSVQQSLGRFDAIGNIIVACLHFRLVQPQPNHIPDEWQIKKRSDIRHVIVGINVSHLVGSLLQNQELQRWRNDRGLLHDLCEPCKVVVVVRRLKSQLLDVTVAHQKPKKRGQGNLLEKARSTPAINTRQLTP